MRPAGQALKYTSVTPISQLCVPARKAIWILQIENFWMFEEVELSLPMIERNLNVVGGVIIVVRVGEKN